MKKFMTKSRIISIVCAIVAVVLIVCSVTLLTGAKKTISTDTLKKGNIVRIKLDTIADFYAETYKSGQEEKTGVLAAAVLDGKIITVWLPERYYESAKTIVSNTQYAESTQFIEVVGTVALLDSASAERLTTWYEENSSLLTYIGVAETDDAAAVTSEYIINVDHYGSFSGVAPVIAILVIGFALLLVAVLLCLKDFFIKGKTGEVVAKEAAPEELETPEEEEAEAPEEEEAEESDNSDE